jgi:hypothetical protein
MIDRLKELHDAARIGKNPVVDADLAHELYGAMVDRDSYAALGDILDDIIEQSGITATEDYGHDIRNLSLRFLAFRRHMPTRDGADVSTAEDYRERIDAFFATAKALEDTVLSIRETLVQFGAITADDTTTNLEQMVAMLLPPS